MNPIRIRINKTINRVLAILLETSVAQQRIHMLAEGRVNARLNRELQEIRANELNRALARLTAALQARNKFETTEKSSYLDAENKLDPRLDVLINVQSAIFYLVHDKDPAELTLSWKEVDRIIREEIKKVTTDRALARRNKHRLR